MCSKQNGRLKSKRVQHDYHMIIGINESKHCQSIYQTNVNAILVVKNVIKIKSGITISVDAIANTWYM